MIIPWGGMVRQSINTYIIQNMEEAFLIHSDCYMALGERREDGCHVVQLRMIWGYKTQKLLLWWVGMMASKSSTLAILNHFIGLSFYYGSKGTNLFETNRPAITNSICRDNVCSWKKHHQNSQSVNISSLQLIVPVKFTLLIKIRKPNKRAQSYDPDIDISASKLI